MIIKQAKSFIDSDNQNQNENNSHIIDKNQLNNEIKIVERIIKDDKIDVSYKNIHILSNNKIN